jgi:O-antigen ligase/tetratricopeptide (TPR) repeat protein
LVRTAVGPLAGTGWEKVRFFVLLAFLVVCLLGGGASRADVSSLVYLRLAAILCLLDLVVSPGEWEFRRFRIPLILLGLLAATMAIQLIPLPPGLWASLPGFSRYTEAAAAAGLAEAWHPISLAPDLTLNSLLALLPCLVVLVGFAGIREDQRRTLLPVLVGFVAADALLSVAQFAGGPDSPAYLYDITNSEAPVGFFSNRNHNAALLAMALPMLAVWIATPSPSRQYQRARNWTALAFGLFLIAVLLATGSRAGMVAGIFGLLAAFWLAPSFTAGWDRHWRIAFRAATVVIPLLLVAFTIYADRATSLFRMTDTAQLSGELRIEALPVLTDMVRTFSPQGIGYGAFDPVFRGFEPDSLLSPQYFNHAHNDLIELALTGGVTALLVLLLFVIWWGARVVRIVSGDRRRTSDRLTRLAAVMILILLGASLVDYPLRTPLLAAVFTIACCWLTAPHVAVAVTDRPETEDSPRLRRRGVRRAAWAARIAAGVVVAVALGWLAIGVTQAAVDGRMRPNQVAWWPLDADAHANRAARVLESGARIPPAALAGATADAQAALQREPVNAVAARTLGLLAARRGNEAQANRLMRYSEMLSRRDLLTQLWMIESNVQRNDIGEALRHYDRALRTSDGARDLLFPILIDAAASPAVTPQLGRLLAARPAWWEAFVTRLVTEGRSPMAIEAIILATRLDPAIAGERSLLGAAVNRLTQLGDYQRALDLYRRAGGTGNALVRNGNFEADNRFAPLDWVLGDSLGAGGMMQPGLPGGGRALLMVVEPGSSGGTVARQLLVLPAGAYRFTALAGRVSGEDRPRITLTCVRSNAALFDLRLPASGPGGQTIGQDFTVGGAACPAQWLIIAASQPTGDEGPWIDRISVMPAR